MLRSEGDACSWEKGAGAAVLYAFEIENRANWDYASNWGIRADGAVPDVSKIQNGVH